MGKHILFLVHGMGDAKPGWSQETQQLIRGLYNKYNQLSLLVPFDQNFTFQEIYYNDKFDERRKAWKEHAEQVLQAISQGGLDANAAKLLAGYAAETDRDRFLNTHILDVILYRFIPQVAEQIRNAVCLQILETLKAQPQADTLRWSVIAHSLGTAVIHDTLHAMYTQSSAASVLPPSVTRSKVLAMLANVSRVLETDADVYTSVVRPDVNPAQGVCDYYLNARHEWDPIPVPKQFRPLDDWPNVETRRDNRYQSLLINAIESQNVHDLLHYLKNPKVHIPLFRALTWQSIIDDATAVAASAQYEASTPIGQFQGWIEKLKKIWPNEQSNWRDTIKTFRSFQDLLNKDN